MNYKKANWGFFGMVMLHFAVIFALLFVRNLEMGMMANLLVSELTLIIPAFAVLFFSKEKPNRVLGFHKLKVSSVLMVFVFTFLMMPLTTLLNAISMLFVDNAVTQMSGQVLSYPFVVMFFMMAIYGPVCEELCFRGIIYRSYIKSGNLIGAILLSSLLFGLIHMNFNQAPYAFVLGVAMALLLEVTGSLWSPILMHVIFNAQSVILMYIYDRFMPGVLEAQAEQVMGAGELLPVISMYLVIAVISTALAACVLVWLCRNEGRTEYLIWLLHEGKAGEKKGKLVSAPLIVGIVLCLAYMLLLAVL